MKIAIVGSEPMSHGLAPWDDSSWEIWGSGLGSWKYPRVDRHYEVHAFDLVERVFGAEALDPYLNHLREQPSVRVLVKQDDLPNGELIPWRKLYKEFSPYFFTSTMAWAMAEAILTPGVTDISLYGIDCTAKEEYALQRQGVQFFIVEAERRGINVSAPLESDIMVPTPSYGLREFDNQYRKALARKRMYEAEVRAAEHEAANVNDRIASGRALIDLLNYEMRTWSGINDSFRSGRET